MPGLFDFPAGAAFGTGSPAETSQQPAGLLDVISGLYNSLGGLAKRNIENSQNSLDTGNYDPRASLEAAMLPMGTGAIAGVPVKGAEAVLGAGPIRAYHGSPHDFDKFDLSKIGTGEGAQAYGHGLYFAENEGVARGYRDTLSGDYFRTPTGRLFDPQQELEHLNVRSRAHSNGSNLDATIELAQRMAASDAPSAIMAQRDLAKLLELKAEGGVTRHNGKMYEVNINADPAHFLDWDKPLSMGSAARGRLKELGDMGLAAHDYGVDRNFAKEAILQANNPNLSGEGAYRTMNTAIEAARPKLKEAGNPRALFGGTAPMASEELVKTGIPGIKYLDQGSRGAGQGSSNYVVFNDKLIDIMRKYGIAGMAAPPVVSQFIDQRQ